MRATSSALANIILIIAVSGCMTAAPPPASLTPEPVSFDGSYMGTIRLTSSSVAGAQSNWCDTPPAISFAIQNNAFNYVLEHPNVPQDPKYPLSPSFAVVVDGDGTFSARSRNGEADMVGRIAGSHLAGNINGTACGYAFTAERS